MQGNNSFSKMVMTFKKNHSNSIIWIVFILLLLKWILYYINLIDIDSHDEMGSYIGRALEHVSFFDISPDWGPLYVLWLQFIALFTLDPITIDYVNFIVVTLMLPVCFSFFLHRRGWSFHWVLFFCMFFFLNPYFIFVVRRPNYFALLIVLISYLSTTYIKNNGLKKNTILLGYILASFVKPEYSISIPFILFCFFIKPFDENRRLYNFYAIIGTILSLLTFLYFFKWGSGKGILTFLIANNERIPNTSIEDIKTLYGNTANISSACLYNSTECLSHFIFNFKEYSNQILESLILQLRVLYEMFKIPLLGTVIFSSFYYFLLKKKMPIYVIDEKLIFEKNVQSTILLFVLIIFPTFVGCIIFAPRPPYEVGHIPILIVFILLFIGQIKKSIVIRPVVIIFFLSLSLVVPIQINTNHPDFPIASKKRTRNLAMWTRTLLGKTNARIFSSDLLLYDFFYPPKFGVHIGMVTDKTLDDVIRINDLNVIILDDFFLGSLQEKEVFKRSKLDASIKDFIVNYKEKGYVLYKYIDHNFYVHNTLLQ